MRGIYLDADWAPAPPTDEDLMREREKLDAALEETTGFENPCKCSDPKQYSARAARRREQKERRMTCFARRIFTRALIFFLWAVAFAMLIGAAD